MTCREKLKLEHPEFVSDRWDGGCYKCPDTHGYLDKPAYCRGSNSSLCASCWNREIPESEPKMNEDTVEELAGLYWKFYHSLIDNGFDRSQAFELLKEFIRSPGDENKESWK